MIQRLGYLHENVNFPLCSLWQFVPSTLFHCQDNDLITEKDLCQPICRSNEMFLWGFSEIKDR